MRLVTRADFDGLVCGALITTMEEIDSYLFVEPKFMQDKLVDIRQGDIIANLPYHHNCSLWFDHHITNNAPGFENPIVPGKGAFRLAPSAARVVYEYYTRQDIYRKAAGLTVLKSIRLRFLLEETDKIDAALLTPEDVLHPEGYVLISMTLDGKREEDEPYWLRLIKLLRDTSLEEVTKDQDVKQRCQQILEDQEKLRKILLERTSLQGNVIFTDLRGLKDVPDGNRFLIYTLFPTGNISLKITEDSQRSKTTAISVGYNIFNPTSKVNVGALLTKHGGGGHKVVGSCRVPESMADKTIETILQAVKD